MLINTGGVYDGARVAPGRRCRRAAGTGPASAAQRCIAPCSRLGGDVEQALGGCYIVVGDEILMDVVYELRVGEIRYLFVKEIGCCRVPRTERFRHQVRNRSSRPISPLPDIELLCYHSMTQPTFGGWI